MPGSRCAMPGSRCACAAAGVASSGSTSRAEEITQQKFVASDAPEAEVTVLYGCDGSIGRRSGLTFSLSAAGSAARYSVSPNSAANRFSPLRVKLTTRLPGVSSRAAHFSSVKRVSSAAPSVPARWWRRSLQSRQARHSEAARMGQQICRDLQSFRKEPLAVGGQFDVVLALAQQALLSHAVEHLHAEIAGEVVVANPRMAQRRVLWSGPHAQCDRRAQQGPPGPRARRRTSGSLRRYSGVGPCFSCSTSPAGLELGQMKNSRSAG